jgi:hypothetical protein
MTTKGAILRAIRENCLDCCCGSTAEVKDCAVGTKCQLFPYRMGSDPNPSKNRGFKKNPCVAIEISKNPVSLEG